MKSSDFQDRIKRSAEWIRRASHMVVFTGAGISTPSGIPDFRSPGSGLWDKYDPFQVASLFAFQKRPEDFFNWIRPLAIQAESTQPNTAHMGLAEMERRGWVKAVITQNIDDLHQKAGSVNVLELHGNARTATCPKCNHRHDAQQFMQILINGQDLPKCLQCGGIIKPDVVLFGEMLPADTWEKAQWHCLQADVVLVVGSSLEVSPANSLPEMGAVHGAKLIINNLSPTFLDSRADILLPMDVTDAVSGILEILTAG